MVEGPQDVGLSNKESRGLPKQEGSPLAGQDGSPSTEKLSIILPTNSEFLSRATFQSLDSLKKVAPSSPWPSFLTNVDQNLEGWNLN